MRIIIKQGHIIDPANKIDKIGDILIEGNKIKKIAEKITSISSSKIINAEGKIVIPGIIDMHVHLREPGREDEETIESGTIAAAHGGITSVVTMANTTPVCDNSSVIGYISQQAKKFGKVNVYSYGVISKNIEGKELSEIGELKNAGVVGISDDGKTVTDSYLMRKAMEYVKAFNLPIISHCEDTSLSTNGVMNEGYFSTILGLPGIPNATEEIIVARDIMLAQLTNSSLLHLTHLSTSGSIELVRKAKKRGLKITCDTCPHYFSLTDKAVTTFNPNTKVNPPLRAEKDLKKIINGLKDDTIDCITTDHAPHTKLEKDVEFSNAPFGIIGLETLLPLIISKLVKPKILSLTKAIEKITINPAKILNLDKGTLSINADADITIVDVNKEEVITENYFRSKSKNSPFTGEKLTGFPVLTLVKGKVVFSADNFVN